MYHSSIICKCEDCWEPIDHQRVSCIDVNPASTMNIDNYSFNCAVLKLYALFTISTGSRIVGSSKVQTLLNNLEAV